MNRDQTGLFAFRLHVVDGLLDRFGYRTHSDYDIFGIGIAVIGERFVFPSGNLADLNHRLSNEIRHGVIEFVRRFTRLEIDIGVLRGSTRYGVSRIQSSLPELGQTLPIEQRSQSLLVDHFDLLDLVRGTETVEEVQERHTRLDCHEVSDTGQIHNLLNAARSQHGETGLTGCHHILMIAEDRESLSGQSPCRYMKDTRQ